MTTLRHDPGCRVAGKGLLTSFQCGLSCLKATLDTCSWHSPTLQIAIVRSLRQQAFTPPKNAEPVTASCPAGALPETATALGPAGSSLVTVIVAEAGPRAVGWKRIGTVIDPPGARISG